ncbi:MAG: cell division protein SepF [Propionibacteriaceae bacterium]|nr:cell division protein SepF [Propionibacteriaceae bacterium]
MGALRNIGVWLGLSVPEEVDDEAPEPAAAEEEAVAEPSQIVDVKQIVSVQPLRYNDARLIGEQYRAGAPVIFDLSEMSTADAKRIIDFGAGLVFGTEGSMERITKNVFLVTPPSVVLDDDTHQDLIESVHTGELPNLVEA